MLAKKFKQADKEGKTYKIPFYNLLSRKDWEKSATKIVLEISRKRY